MARSSTELALVEAVEHGMLTDYKVLILTLNEDDIPQGSSEHDRRSGLRVLIPDDASKLHRMWHQRRLSKKVLG